jgi:hypothetical protein
MPIASLTPTSPIMPAFSLGGDDNDNNNRLLDFGGDNDNNNHLLDFGGDNNNNSNSIVSLAWYVYYNAYYINY